ncbi:MAG: DMT family transporter [Deltaproteobacteria bacterium]|nr:DMT family transporter [Deltaproteobacteria bacterium]
MKFVPVRNRAWLAYALATVGLFGIWQMLPKLPALAPTDPLAVQLAALPGLLTALLVTGGIRGIRHAPRGGVLWALFTGLGGALGTLAILHAFALGGEGSLVTPLCAMYPLVTALGARLVLREKLGAVQKVGFLLFGAAVAAFGAEGASPTSGPIVAWIPYAALAFLIFGASGLSMKVATKHGPASAALTGWSMGFVGATLSLTAVQPADLPPRGPFWVLAFVYGLLMGLGLWTSFEAYRRGKAAVVTAVTALYPAVTVVLSVCWPSINESLSAYKALAIALSLAAGAALAIEPSPSADSDAQVVDPDRTGGINR